MNSWMDESMEVNDRKIEKTEVKIKRGLVKDCWGKRTQGDFEPATGRM